MDAIVDHLLVIEGWPKFTDDPDDRGGPTKGGITLPALSSFLGRPATVAELRDLDERTARSIYEFSYVRKPGFDRVNDEPLRLHLVDAGVLHGPTRATRWLQQSVNAVLDDIGFTPLLHVDGVLGSRTAERVNQTDPRAVSIEFACVRIDGFGTIINSNYKARVAGTATDDQSRFALGWLRREIAFVRREWKRI